MELRDRVERGEKARWGDSMPIWVSRKDAGGMIYHISINIWVQLGIAVALMLWTIIAVLTGAAILIGVPIWLLLALL